MNDIIYTFKVNEKLTPDYRFAIDILTWITNNLKNLTDDKDNKIFSKVNTGFNEETLKTFGKTPVCDVYFKNTEFTSDFDEHKPEIVNTVIIAYLKGANNATYEKASELHDYLMQEFITNRDFKFLNDIVTDTYITNTEIQPRPISKKWGVMVVLELAHILY